MILTLLALAIGLTLVIALWTLSQRKADAPGVFEDPAMRLLPPPGIVNALFDPRDREFAVAENSKELLATLEAQRRSIALLWLSAVHNQALSAIAAYRESARMTASISLADELRILVHACAFLGLHLVLVILVRTVSVFRVQSLLWRLHGLSLPLLSYAGRVSPIQASAS